MDSKPPPADYFSVIGLLAALIALLALSMLFSIAESSFLSMNKLRLRILRRNNDKRAVRVGKLLDKKEILINTLLVSNDLVNILLSSLLTAVFVNVFGAQGVVYATFSATLLLLVFGEITPKTISTRHPDSIAYALSGFVTIVVAIMKPVAVFLTAIARFILQLFGINTQKKKQTYTEEEIRTFIDISREEGVLEKGEDAMMNRIFKFTDLEAQNIMIPRTEIVALPSSASFRDILERAQCTRFSRFPVYKRNIDDIVGVLYVKDLLVYKKNPAEDFVMQNVICPPLFILGTKKMSSVQQMLRENRQSLAIVIDEYSGTDGLLTQEDISREIFGPIGIHAGTDGRFFPLPVTGTNNFIITGSVHLADLREKLRIPLQSAINETVGGWLEEQLDRMPSVGDSIDCSGYRFTILSMDYRRVGKVHVECFLSDCGEED
jgi:putative hemolysin